MTKLLQTTIAGSLPKPSWLAEPKALWAPWRLPAETRDEGIQDAVRLVLRDQEQAGIDIVTDGEQTRRHFVTTFIEGLDGVDFEHRKIRAHPQPLRCRRPGRRRTRRAPAPRVPRRRAVPACRDRPPDQGHAAGADDDGRHSLRRALWEPRKARLGVRRNPERGGARDRGRRGRRDPVRRTGVQRLFRRSPRVGGGCARARGQGSRRARLPCTSATATGSRRTSTGRRRSARNGGSTRRPFPCWRVRPSGRCRSSARTPAFRSSSSDSSTARMCWSGPSTSRRTGSKPPRMSRRRSARHCGTCRPERLYPCTNCGMVPLAREVARAKLRALGAGAALVRAELAAPGRCPPQRTVRPACPAHPGRPRRQTGPRNIPGPSFRPLPTPKKPLAPAVRVVYPPQSVLVSRQ